MWNENERCDNRNQKVSGICPSSFWSGGRNHLCLQLSKMQQDEKGTERTGTVKRQPGHSISGGRDHERKICSGNATGPAIPGIRPLWSPFEYQDHGQLDDTVRRTLSASALWCHETGIFKMPLHPLRWDTDSGIGWTRSEFRNEKLDVGVYDRKASGRSENGSVRLRTNAGWLSSCRISGRYRRMLSDLWWLSAISQSAGTDHCHGMYGSCEKKVWRSPENPEKGVHKRRIKKDNSAPGNGQDTDAV